MLGTNDFHWGEFLHSFDLKYMNSYFSSQKNAKIFKIFLKKFGENFKTEYLTEFYFLEEKNSQNDETLPLGKKNAGSHNNG
jgi:hypothetical protein